MFQQQFLNAYSLKEGQKKSKIYAFLYSNLNLVIFFS